MPRPVLAIVLGLALSVAISLVSYSLTPGLGVVWPIWYGAYRTLSTAALSVAPGLLAGWYAGRNGWRLGAILGICVTITSVAFIPLVWGRLSTPMLVNIFLFGGIATIATHSVAGAAGAALGQRRAP